MSSALQIHPGSVKKTFQKATAMLARAGRVKEKTSAMLGQAVHTLEVSGAAFGMGLLSGKAGKVPEVAGVPIDLAVGTALHIAGFAGLGGRNNQHLHGLGDGALAHFAAMQGMAAGAAWEAKHGGSKPATAGEGLTDAEARRYAQGQ